MMRCDELLYKYRVPSKIEIFFVFVLESTLGTNRTNGINYEKLYLNTLKLI